MSRPPNVPPPAPSQLNGVRLPSNAPPPNGATPIDGVAGPSAAGARDSTGVNDSGNGSGSALAAFDRNGTSVEIRQAIEDDRGAVLFGPVRFEPTNQRLLEEGRPLPVGSRALDILAKLLEKPGELVTKDELVAHVWPTTVVDESNLRTQMSALRHVLRDGEPGRRFVATIPGRGYRFVGQVVRPQPPAPLPAELRPGHPPAPLTRLIGRERELEGLRRRLMQARLVTIAGPGGVGKSSLAASLAQEMKASFKDGVNFINMSFVADASLVGGTLASAFASFAGAPQTMRALSSFLENRQTLIVLDGCEHVIDAVATHVDTMLRAAPQLKVLVTSRERLRVEGECVDHLSPLRSPAKFDTLTAAQAVEYPAVQLFIERVSAIDSTFELTDAVAPLVGEICARLDGLPLALEMAAARVEQFGLVGVAARLDERFVLLVRGQRTALARQQTLKATLDWSYNTLSERERLIFRRLAAFTGPFTLEAAGVVCARPGQQREAIDAIADLVGKSLVVRDFNPPTPEYRLLDTTRAYALDKLIESGEQREVARRHAAYYRDLHAAQAAEPPGQPPSASLRRQVANVHAALDWGFSTDGDREVAIDLAIASAPIWFRFGMLSQCRARVQQALSALSTEDERQSRRAMQLYDLLATVTLAYKGAAAEADEAWERARAIAERLDDVDYRLKATWGLQVSSFLSMRVAPAMVAAKRYRAIAEAAGLTLECAIGDRLIGNVLYMRGDYFGAVDQYDKALRRLESVTETRPRQIYFYDQRTALNCMKCPVLWALGLADQSLALARSTVEDAAKKDDTSSLLAALAGGACPVAERAGLTSLAEDYIARLESLARGHPGFSMYARCHRGMLEIQRGNVAAGVECLVAGLGKVPSITVQLDFFGFKCGLADGWRRLGEPDRAEQTLLPVLDSALASGVHAFVPELKRVLGEILCDKGDRDRAQVLVQEAVASAREQGALGWELRAATSRARLLLDAGRPQEARTVLADTYGRVKEGFASRDVTEARRLLSAIG